MTQQTYFALRLADAGRQTEQQIRRSRFTNPETYQAAESPLYIQLRWTGRLPRIPIRGGYLTAKAPNCE